MILSTNLSSAFFKVGSIVIYFQQKTKVAKWFWLKFKSKNEKFETFIVFFRRLSSFDVAFYLKKLRPVFYASIPAALIQRFSKIGKLSSLPLFTSDANVRGL